MTSVLKGNFSPKKKVESATEGDEDLEATFEASALMRLGGSVAFVSKKRVNWDLEGE